MKCDSTCKFHKRCWLLGESLADEGEECEHYEQDFPVKQGEWIIHADDLYPSESTQECSVCHAEQYINGNDDDYCPKCGSKMKAVDDT